MLKIDLAKSDLEDDRSVCIECCGFYRSVLASMFKCSAFMA